MVHRFIDWLVLTRTEQRVIVFLASTLVVGGGIRLYQESHPPKRQFDYQAADSTFAAFQGRLAIDTLQRKAAISGKIVDINTALKNELKSLPGIGDSLADRIYRYREEHGAFASVEDLRNVKGISAKKLEKLKPFVTVQ